MAITPLPTPPSRDDPTNFAARGDAFLGALPDFATEANALAVDVNADAVAAAAAETAATAAAAAATAAANVTKWVSGTTYAEGVMVWSPITYLSYRRKTAGGGTTDPSADSTNWAQAAGTGDVTLTGTQTLTNKTMTNVVLDGSYTEDVYTLGTSGSIALDPANGTIQSCAAAGTVTFTDSLSSGQSISLRLTSGASYTINWPTITWVTSAGNTAPTLTANDTLVFWKISTTLYGAYVGSGA